MDSANCPYKAGNPTTTSSTTDGYYDSDYGSYYDNATGTYSIGSESSFPSYSGKTRSKNSGLLNFIYACWLPLSILACCLCCCGKVIPKKYGLCWWNCYGCVKEEKDGETVVVVQPPANQIV